MKSLILVLTISLGISVFAQNTYVPDDNFEQELINLGYDSGTLNDFVPTANIINLTSLDLSFKNIADLTAIQDFSSLLFLGADGNQITSIDISNNNLIEELSANDNSFLTAINTNGNNALLILHAARSKINSVNFSNNPLLVDLDLNDNKLTSLDVSNNPDLGAVFIKNNLLTALDVSQNPDLMYLVCNDNQITSLDLSNNPKARWFDASNNQLICLNVQNGNNYPYWMWDEAFQPKFVTLNNPNLTCIQVDDVAKSNIYWTQKDSWTGFSLSCGSCSLNNSETIEKLLSIYPNPTKDKIYFKDLKNISRINIYDATGKLVKSEIPSKNSSDVSSLTSGNYFLEIISNGKTIKTKIIKN